MNYRVSDGSVGSTPSPHFIGYSGRCAWIHKFASDWAVESLERIDKIASQWEPLTPVHVVDSSKRVMPRYVFPPAPLENGRCEFIDASIQSASATLAEYVTDLCRKTTVNVTLLSQIVRQFYSFLVNHWDETLMASAQYAGSSLYEKAVLTSIYASAIAVECGYSSADVVDIGLCALIGDIGMNRVSAEKRETERMQSPSEYREIHRHVLHTLELSRHIAGLSDKLRAVCLQIHERPNGAGYPYSLENEQIHGWAQAIAVADAYTAMTSNQRYRKQLIPFAAMQSLIMLSNRRALGCRFVGAMIKATSLFPIGSHVQLPDGRRAQVIRRQFNQHTNPILQIENDTDQIVPISDISPAPVAISLSGVQQESVSDREIEFQQVR
jgi:HD-GYP domain-containing protein (c-di-GMP phosphodiesterase class II)